ncbi:hypothetical protein LRAMOSA01687 [Lichtheimia ramosa]|uniref:NodB homology domain-containing protein n=1 Tax=Lichtheimia ramosa TaxID=688394 RepID=A0A077WKN5_9FUNG|nr:hypothetical protein LRAMOSA01687 [Lichtheimia ramosa]
MRLSIALGITLSYYLVSAVSDDTGDKTGSGILAVSSPAWLAEFRGPSESAQGHMFNVDDSIKSSLLDTVNGLDLSRYPQPSKRPPVDDPEVKAVIDQLDWSKVPKISKRRLKGEGELDMQGYDTKMDPDCWWSSTTCKEPRLNYIPEDVSFCSRAGDWGLNYDDGPFRVWSKDAAEQKWQEPRLYNYLAEQNNQKATLFYIGSNVISFPEAAQRALQDGHTICSHTWSHPLMTTLTNEEVVSEFYWTQKAIKEVLGITPKCWRPPFGDVDDRVRAIAWLMGMRTIIWDRDTNDWGLASQSINATEVDGYYKEWLDSRVDNQDNEHGHITLQHESSRETVEMVEKWLPKLQEQFNVMPIHQCLNDPYPYWEENWVYPTIDNPTPGKDQLQAASADKKLDNNESSSVHQDHPSDNHQEEQFSPSAANRYVPSIVLLFFASLLTIL